MDWLQFFASVTGSLAWPIAVVALAYLVRGPLARLIPRVRSLKYGEFHMDIAGELERMELAVKAVVAEPEFPVEDMTPEFLQTAQLIPGEAVIEAWLPVQMQLMEIAKKAGVTPMMHFPLVREIGVLKTFDPSLFETVQKLWGIRNTVVHAEGHPVTHMDALKMGDMCRKVTAQLKAISSKL